MYLSTYWLYYLSPLKMEALRKQDSILLAALFSVPKRMPDIHRHLLYSHLGDVSEWLSFQLSHSVI